MGKQKEIFYPVASASFKKIREGGFLYVDKTSYIHKMVEEGRGNYIFLARPRRFGKSLLVSAMHEYFEGDRELFQGLDIDKLQPGEWEKYPVLRFDLSGSAFTGKDDLENLLKTRLEIYEREFGININGGNAAIKFENLLSSIKTKTGKRVVILIDEYDSPLTATIDRTELQDLFREELHGFYSVLKKMEDCIRFCFLTGVTRYGKVSVFSGLNNLEDITFLDEYAGICGITEKELHKYYAEGVGQYASHEGMSEEEAYGQLKFFYDGYHFSKSLLDVYNPFSLNRALKYKEIKDYWCESGTPMVFLKMLMKMDYNLEKLQDSEVTESELSNLGVFTKNPVPLFFQTGYLTLKTYDKEDKLFTLGYPNREVEIGILRSVLQVYNPQEVSLSRILLNMKRSLKSGDPEKFIEGLTTYFADIPGDLKEKVAKYERYYQTVIYCLLSLLGLETRAEYGVAGGFIDLLVKTDSYIYVIELKVNGTAEEAMQQIERKNYCAPFAMDPRRLYRVAIGFSKEAQNIQNYIID